MGELLLETIDPAGQVVPYGESSQSQSVKTEPEPKMEGIGMYNVPTSIAPPEKDVNTRLDDLERRITRLERPREWANGQKRKRPSSPNHDKSSWDRSSFRKRNFVRNAHH